MAVAMLGSIPATWATVTTFAADDAAVMGFSELANAVVKEFFPWEAPKLIDMAGPAAVTGYAQPSWSVVTGAAVAVAGFWGGLGTWLGHLFDKRDVQSVSIIAHFYRTNFTIGDVRGLNGFIVEPHADGSAMFRQGGYSWPGQVALISTGKGLAHGDFELHVHKEGYPHTEHGRWLAVDTSETSEAEAHVQDTFQKLQKILGVTGEDGPESFSRALEIAEAALASNATS